ncbi:hypothetical protein Tco_1345920 [Tanacetum coccineum]
MAEGSRIRKDEPRSQRHKSNIRIDHIMGNTNLKIDRFLGIFMVTVVYESWRERWRKWVLMNERESISSSSGPALHDMTPVTISSGLVSNPPPLTLFVPPMRFDWDLLFQPMFDESLNPPPYVDLQAPEVIAPIPEVVAPKHAVLTGSPSSTTVDQDAPSPSKVVFVFSEMPLNSILI